MITKQKLIGLAICLMIFVPLLGFGSIMGVDNLVKPSNRSLNIRGRAAENIIVDINGNGNYTEIQDAVDNASSGDNITVWPGVYLENITIDKTLNLTGSGIGVTFINANGIGSGIHIIADKVNISGFTIINSVDRGGFAGIKLENADNCTIMNNNCSENRDGIRIENSNYAIIMNNNCSENRDGIRIENSNNTRILNNFAERNNVGIILFDSENVIIMNNTCENNWDDGIYMRKSNNNKIINNSFSWCGSNGIEIDDSNDNILDNNNCNGRALYNDGISLYNSHGNTLINNTCNDNDYYGIFTDGSNGNIFENNTCLNNLRDGISLYWSLANVVKNNELVNCGLMIRGTEIDHFLHTIDHSNTINGKIIYYYRDRVGKTVPGDAGAVILVNCSKFVIDGLVLNNGSTGIKLFKSSNVTITKNTCNGNLKYGIYLFSSKDIIVTDNICENNGYIGVYLRYAQNVRIKNNLLLNSQTGISTYYSKYNEITNNICSNHEDYGIGSRYSDYDEIANNTCNDNSYGMYLDEDFSIIDNNTCLFNDKGFQVVDDNNLITNNTCSFNNETGLVLRGSYENSVKSNTLTSNNYYGMEISYCNKNTITDNLIHNNTIYGISISQSSKNNILFNNNFISNGNQSKDSGKNNWNTSAGIGNFWSDLQVKYPNATNDGYIWDTPYEIPGLAGALDYSPLVKYVSDFILNIRPTAVIQNILPNPAVYGENITFVGHGSDVDGFITRYRWRSDIDGIFGNTSFFSYRNLSRAKHTISFMVMDDLGDWSKDTMTLTIGPKFPFNGTLRPRGPIVITNNNEFTHDNGVKSGSGSFKDPYIIEGWKITGHLDWMCRSCIYINNTDKHFIIRNNYLNDSGLCQIGAAGIRSSNVTNGTIENNTITQDDYYNMYGIMLEYSSNISIINNRILNSSDAAFIILYSQNNTITNNICNNNRMGIYSIGSDNNIFENNWFSTSESFIALSWSSWNMFNNNSVINFTNFRIWKSENNTFHHNNFIFYNEVSIMGQEDKIDNNSWDDGLGQGNFWSNYSGRDSGENGRVMGDGVGDTNIPYMDLDNYPLMKPTEGFINWAKENIGVELNVDKKRYISGEKITGKIKISNNNYFDLYSDDPEIFPMSYRSMGNLRFEFTNLDSDQLETFYYQGFYTVKIEGKATVINNLSLPGVVYKDLPSKLLPRIKLRPGNYSLKLTFPLYIDRFTFLEVNTSTQENITVHDHSVVENISLTLETSKSSFNVGEPITGTINVRNDNPFKIKLMASPPLSAHLLGHHFTIYSIENAVTVPGINNYDLTPIDVGANANIDLDFAIERFYDEYSSRVGNYSIYSWFYYSNDSAYYQDVLANSSEILRIESNHAEYEIISRDVVGSDNISISLKLDKQEYKERDPVTGTIKITNSNLFDIVLDDVLYQRITGHHFVIYSFDNRSNFGGIASEFQGSLTIKAHDISAITFSIDKFILPPTSKIIQYVGLSPGNYSIYAFFYYTNSTDKINSDTLWSNRAEFRIIENTTDWPDTNVTLDDGNETQPDGSYGAVFYQVVGICIIFIMITIMFIGSTEMGKYGFFGAIGPLYTKTRKRKKDHEYGYIKGSVRGYILGNPGESYNTIKNELELPNGTLAYYLKVLERDRLIKSERDGFLKRFYPIGGMKVKDVLELSQVQENIKMVIQKHPGASQKDILANLDISQQKLNYHIQLMVKARMIKLEREGKITKCYVIEDTS